MSATNPGLRAVRLELLPHQVALGDMVFAPQAKGSCCCAPRLALARALRWQTSLDACFPSGLQPECSLLYRRLCAASSWSG